MSTPLPTPDHARLYALTEALANAWGPCGHEQQVRALVREHATPFADQVFTDPLGNLICRVGQGGPRVLVTAHMDEIGFMPLFAEPSTGLLRFAALGTLFRPTLRGRRVRFADGTIGVVGVDDALGANRDAVPALDAFFIDPLGADAAALVGQPTVVDAALADQNNHWTGKALDDRVGCAVLLEAMRLLHGRAAQEVVFAFTVQEETGPMPRGAGPAAYSAQPALAIAVDVTATGDQPHSRPSRVMLGGGPAIKLYDAGSVVPPWLRDWMLNGAQQAGLPHQRETLTGGATDAMSIQQAGPGVPSGALSIPLRGVHTASEVVHADDVAQAAALLAVLLAAPVPQHVA